jgi:acylphosphatase
MRPPDPASRSWENRRLLEQERSRRPVRHAAGDGVLKFSSFLQASVTPGVKVARPSPQACTSIKVAVRVHMRSEREMPSSEKAVMARRFVVRGRVQGVGFRWFVEREAHVLGIAGWVRNNADATVEVLAMGTREQLDGLRSRLQQGPRAARVDEVQESEAKPVAGLTIFRIEGAW